MPMDELLDCPIWWNGKDIVEAAFCEEFTRNHQLAYDCSAFFTPEGHMTDERPLKQKIYHELKICAVKNVHELLLTAFRQPAVDALLKAMIQNAGKEDTGDETR